MQKSSSLHLDDFPIVSRATQYSDESRAARRLCWTPFGPYSRWGTKMSLKGSGDCCATVLQ